MNQGRFPLYATRAVIAAVLALLSLTSLYGREKKSREPLPFKYEVRAGWSGYSMYDASLVIPDFFFTVYSPSLSDLYADQAGDTYLTGTFSAEIDFHFRKWFALSLGVGCDGIYSKKISADTGKQTGMYRGAILTFIPQFRFSYLDREYVKLYSSIGFGYMYGVYNKSYVNGLAAQLVPVGVTAGKKVF